MRDERCLSCAVHAVQQEALQVGKPRNHAVVATKRQGKCGHRESSSADHTWRRASSVAAAALSQCSSDDVRVLRDCMRRRGPLQISRGTHVRHNKVEARFACSCCDIGGRIAECLCCTKFRSVAA